MADKAPDWARSPGDGFAIRAVLDDKIIWESATRTVYQLRDEEAAVYTNGPVETQVARFKRLPLWRRIPYTAAITGFVGGIVGAELVKVVK